jgi:hypothetical protein
VRDGEAVASSDHHTEYLAAAVAALTPEGRSRAGELLAQLGAAAAGDGPVVRFAADRATEVDLGRPVPPTGAPPEPGDVDRLLAGFIAIRDQEPRDDVADWANAVVALLEDVRGA